MEFQYDLKCLSSFWFIEEVLIKRNKTTNFNQSGNNSNMMKIRKLAFDLKIRYVTLRVD